MTSPSDQPFLPGFEPLPQSLADRTGQFLLPGLLPADLGECLADFGVGVAPLMQVRDVVPRYLGYLQPRVDPEHFANVRRILHRFVARFGAQLVPDQCRAGDLEDFLQAHPSWRAKDSRTHAVNAVVGCFHWAADRELITRCPYRRLRGMDLGERKQAKPITEAQYAAILPTAGRIDGRVRDLLEFLEITGWRPKEARTLEVDGELSGLRWDKRLVFNKRHKTTKKDPRPRVAEIDAELEALLRRVLSDRAKQLERLAKRRRWHQDPQRPEPAELFLNRCGRPWTRRAIDKRFRDIRDQLGLPRDCKLYGLRHKFVTETLWAGVDLKTAAELVGHKQASTTEIYAHLGVDYFGPGDANGDGQADQAVQHLQEATRKLRSFRRRRRQSIADETNAGRPVVQPVVQPAN